MPENPINSEIPELTEEQRAAGHPDSRKRGGAGPFEHQTLEDPSTIVLHDLSDSLLQLLHPLVKDGTIMMAAVHVIVKPGVRETFYFRPDVLAMILDMKGGVIPVDSERVKMEMDREQSAAAILGNVMQHEGLKCARFIEKSCTVGQAYLTEIKE